MARAVLTTWMLTIIKPLLLEIDCLFQQAPSPGPLPRAPQGQGGGHISERPGPLRYRGSFFPDCHPGCSHLILVWPLFFQQLGCQLSLWQSQENNSDALHGIEQNFYRNLRKMNVVLTSGTEHRHDPLL